VQAMKERDDEEPLSEYIQIDDAYWGGVRRCVRGRGAKGNVPLLRRYRLMKKGIQCV